MCFAVPAEPHRKISVLAEAMDKIFTLHADHEQNASTSTVRLAVHHKPIRLPVSQLELPLFGGHRMRCKSGGSRDAGGDW